MKKMIIALGNPGPRYEHTRHNAGWLYLDRIKPDLHWTSFDSKTQVAIDESVVYVKPLTYMNKSGEAAVRVWNYYNKDTRIHPNTLLVIHDELDIEPGAVRMQENRGPAGHNGVSSVIQSFGTKNFTRLRLGIGRPEHPDTAGYVLEPFQETNILDTWVEQSKPNIDEWAVT